MTRTVLYKLAAIFFTVAIGWIAGRARWLGAAGADTDPARVLGHAAFYIFVPALLFRTTARLDLHHLPWVALAAFFVPVLLMLFANYAWQRARRRGQAGAAGDRSAALPSAHTIAAVFGNTVQIGIPLIAGVFGEAGLGIHVTLVSVHALVLLSVLTALVELDLARARARHDASGQLIKTLSLTVRNTVIHPVVLPVLGGLAWNLSDLRLPAVLDETLALLGTAVAPLCLVLIGLSLAYTHVHGAWRAAAAITVLKLVVQPVLVLGVARFGFGLQGLPLTVVVMLATLPCGSNALIFAQRYRAHEAETTAAIVLSTFAFVVTAPLWLAALALLG